VKDSSSHRLSTAIIIIAGPLQQQGDRNRNRNRLVLVRLFVRSKAPSKIIAAEPRESCKNRGTSTSTSTSSSAGPTREVQYITFEYVFTPSTTTLQFLLSCPPGSSPVHRPQST
jgi:hypothetical protein